MFPLAEQPEPAQMIQNILLNEILWWCQSWSSFSKTLTKKEGWNNINNNNKKKGWKEWHRLTEGD